MNKHFIIRPFTIIDKKVRIDGPEDINLYVDYDDVHHTKIKKTLTKMVKILNENWDK